MKGKAGFNAGRDHPGKSARDSPADGSGGPGFPSCPGCTDWIEKGPRGKGFPRPQSRGRMEFPGRKPAPNQPHLLERQEEPGVQILTVSGVSHVTSGARLLVCALR